VTRRFRTGYIENMHRYSIFPAAIGLAAVSAGCYTIKPVTFETFGGERIEQVWVTRKDQSVVFIKNADVSGGKLRGYVDHQYQELPASDVQAIKVRQFSTGKTLALVGAGVGAGIAIMAIASGSEDHYDGCAGNPRCDEDTPALRSR
jgi:hypothetical protein